MTNNYIVATIKNWNIEEFEQTSPSLSGTWTLINDHNQLTLKNLRKLNPKYIFFPHWSWLVPESILNEFTCICFHMTDVPYGRGGSPLQNLISRGHQTTKLTALKMTNQLDAGDVYLKAPLSLEGSAQEIFQRCAKLTFEMIKSIITIEPTPIAQAGEVTTFIRRTPEQSKVQGTETLTELYDLIRMMDADSYPKAFLHYGNFSLTFEQANLTSSKSKEPILNTNVIIKKRITNLSEKNND